MTKLCVARFLRADLGQNLVEYALLLACVALSATVAMQAFGVMLGAKLGARLLRVVPAATVRRVVIALLVIAGARALLKGTGLWN